MLGTYASTNNTCQYIQYMQIYINSHQSKYRHILTKHKNTYNTSKYNQIHTNTSWYMQIHANKRKYIQIHPCTPMQNTNPIQNTKEIQIQYIPNMYWVCIEVLNTYQYIQGNHWCQAHSKLGDSQANLIISSKVLAIQSGHIWQEDAGSAEYNFMVGVWQLSKECARNQYETWEKYLSRTKGQRSLANNQYSSHSLEEGALRSDVKLLKTRKLSFKFSAKSLRL